MSEIITHLNQSIGRLRAFLKDKEHPVVAIYTGTSGPKGLVQQLEKKVQLSFEQLYFTKPGADGHVGVLYYGYLSGVPVLVMQGRVHYFEGVSIHEVVHAVRTLRLYGIDHFVFTNASGALRDDLKVGDIVFINDHVNNMGVSPLRGFPLHFVLIGELEPRKLDRFVDMRNAYDTEWLGRCEMHFSMHLKNAVYTAVHGPEFETPAEIEQKYAPQADIIGMSTISEVIALRHLGAKVLALSLVTNLTGVRAEKAITHDNNLSVVESKDETFCEIIKGCVKELAFVLESAEV